MARNQTGRRRRFAELLSKHLTNGTRPATEAGEPWTDSAFAAEVHSQRETNDFVSPRSVSNWRKAKSVPAAIDPILRALFGPGQRHAQARDELRTAFLAARAEKIGNARRNSAGPRWVASDDEFVIDSAATRSDETAALDPQRRLLQQAVSSIAAELASVAGRLSNSRTWGSLSGTADALHVASAADPIALTRRLGEAYPTLLRLGRFLETDIRIQRDPTSQDDPLDPDVQGLLTDLVRTAAPWLRGFPTVEAWDDAAGRYLLRVNLLSAARDFIRVARAKGAISETSASRMEWIEEDEHQGFQGQKANAWGVGGAQNLILATAEVMALFLSGALPSGAGSQSLLVERAAATLSEAGEQVEKFAETLPSDLGQALRELVKEAALSTQSSSPRATGESVPPDVEEQAATMILRALPACCLAPVHSPAQL